MAPNTKHISIIVQQLSPADFALGKPHYVPLTQDANAPVDEAVTAQDKEDYWSWDTNEQVSEQDSYWDWSFNPSQDVLSSTHIIKNLVKSHVQKTDLVHSNIDSVSYWDESTVKDQEARYVSAQHVNEESVESYWIWPADVDERKETIARIVQDEKILQLLSANHITATIQKEASDLYWKDSENEEQADSHDYWEMPANVTLATSGN